MKRAASIFLLGAMVLSLAACGKTAKESPAPAAAPVETTAPVETAAANEEEHAISGVVNKMGDFLTLLVDGEKTAFIYADYNYEDIEDTDCLPAVAQYLVRHLRGYYNISRTFYTVPKPRGKGVEERTRMVFVRRHHENTPFDPKPAQEMKLF